MMPRISVIIPAFNATKTIVETIQSVQHQTFSDLEILVINDGSTDDTLEKLQTIQDERLKVFSYENGGLPVARNRGIQQAQGEFLSFLDADDVWLPHKLAAQIAALEAHPEAGAAYSWTVFIDENSQPLYCWEPIFFNGDIYPQLLIENFISSGSNILVRKTAIAAVGEFDASLKSAEDWDYYLRLAAHCPFMVVPQYHILYRRSAQSMTSKVDVMEANICRVIERAFAQVPESLKHLKNQSLAHNYRFLAQICLANASDRASVQPAFQKLRRAIAAEPRILYQRQTQRLVGKLLLLQLLPYPIAVQLSRRLGKRFPGASTQNLPQIQPPVSVVAHSQLI